MSITYTISPDSKIGKVGELDAEIFNDNFQNDILPAILQDHPNFIKWVSMLYGSGIGQKLEYRFADCFGTWFVYKIGEKGVSNTIELANVFESRYRDETINSTVGFNALITFLQQDWSNEEKQFIETNSVRKLVEKTVKKVKKILKDAHKHKKKEAVEEEKKMKYKLDMTKDNLKNKGEA